MEEYAHDEVNDLKSACGAEGPENAIQPSCDSVTDWLNCCIFAWLLTVNFPCELGKSPVAHHLQGGHARVQQVSFRVGPYLGHQERLRGILA